MNDVEIGDGYGDKVSLSYIVYSILSNTASLSHLLTAGRLECDSLGDRNEHIPDSGKKSFLKNFQKCLF